VLHGELVSDAGTRYQIVEGIPRLLSGQAADFVRRNKKSFSLEWKYSRSGERNWGQDLEFRKNLFLKALGEAPVDLHGKLILDAGCGSGLLSMEMANSFGMEVIALDLASGIENAYRGNKNGFVHFIQASVLEPPLMDRIVDYIYCAGVLIHLPNTRQAFGVLPRVLKRGGRYFVWVYLPIELHERRGDRIKESIYHRIRSRLTCRLPTKVQEMLYLCLLVPFFLKRSLVKLFRIGSENRTWREKMQNYVDTFSPTYVNRHREEEVLEWYRQNGFERITLAYKERYGFGVRGDLPEKPLPHEFDASSNPKLAFHSAELTRSGQSA
jgi:ubiquinone/menaquinone biosynthesis C-methylase UbiE